MLRPPRTLIALALAAEIAAALAVVERAAHGAAGSIVLARQATVSGEVIRLGEVAELGGEGRGLADVDLGRAPAPGESSRLGGEAILRRLREAGLDEASIVYTIPSSVRITRAFQEIPEQELREAIRARIEPSLGAGEAIEDIALPPSARLPLGAYALDVDEPRVAGTTSRVQRAEVRVLQGQEVVARVPARITLAATGTVVVARRALERGTVLHAEDLDLEERSLSGLPSSVVRDLAEAVGKEVRLALVAGRPIAHGALAARSLVRKGDSVRLQIETPSLRLSVPGEALEDAGEGQPVRVVNPASGKEVTGRVVTYGVVAVSR